MWEFQQILAVTKAKRDLLDIAKRIEKEDENIAITRNGEPVGVMRGISQYEPLMETDPQRQADDASSRGVKKRF
jgi:prevent-host-death family protein